MPKVHDEVVFEEWWKILKKCWFWCGFVLGWTEFFGRDEDCRSWSCSISWSDWRWRARWRRKFCRIRLVSQPLEVDEPQRMSCEKWLLHFFSYLVLFRSKCLVVVLNNNKWFLLFFCFFFRFVGELDWWRSWRRWNWWKCRSVCWSCGRSCPGHY